MKYNEVIEMLNTYESEFDYFDDDNSIDIEVNDFEGFDEDWNEIDREFDTEIVNKVFNALKDNCIEYIEDFYTTFKFDTFTVSWGYVSYNI